jgi:hypothetical protein
MGRVMNKPCKGCGSVTRKVTAPGPRCATCHRERKAALKGAAHARRILKTYGITYDQYWALYEAQGGVCYICQRAKGITKKLAVDHDHATGYVRGLLCTTCNKFIGHLRDDPDAGWRVGDYLFDPPAFRTIGKVKPDGTEQQ